MAHYATEETLLELFKKIEQDPNTNNNLFTVVKDERGTWTAYLSTED